MTSSATHEVFNQSPPFEDVDLFTLDRPLVDAVAMNDGASAHTELSEFGRHWGAAAMAARGRAANETAPANLAHSPSRMDRYAADRYWRTSL